MFERHVIPSSLDEAITTAKGILKKEVKKEPVKAKLCVKTEERVFETELIFLHKFDAEKIESLKGHVQNTMLDIAKYPSYEEIELLIAPILVDGFKFYRLSKDLAKATETAKDILMFQTRGKKLQAKLSVKVAGVKYDTSLITLKNEMSGKIYRLRAELEVKFPNAKYDEILLLTSPLKRAKVSCPKCDKKMFTVNLERHLKTCGTEKGEKVKCGKCDKEMFTANLKRHLKTCGTKEGEKVKCVNCDQEMLSTELNEHLKKCGDTEKVKCGKCDKEMFPKDLKRHLKTCGTKEGEKVKCVNCDQEMLSTELNEHLKKCGDTEKVKCGKCDKEMFPSHLERHLKTCGTKEGEKVKCVNCDQEMLSTELNEHLKKCGDTEKVKCGKCDKEMFPRNLERHIEVCELQKQCPVCQKSVHNLGEHIEKNHVKKYPCNVCGKEFFTGAKRAIHQKICGVADYDETAIDGLFRIVELKTDIASPDFEGVLTSEIDCISDILETRMDPALKFYIGLQLNMKRPIDTETSVVSFQSKSTAVLPADNRTEIINNHIAVLIERIEKFCSHGSGWTVEGVKSINIMITKLNAGGGSFIKLPKQIKGKKSLLNIKSDDQKCLLWCLLAALHKVEKNGNLVNSYREFESELDMTGVTYPVSLQQIKRIEMQNGLAISVFAWDEEEGFHPIQTTEAEGTYIPLLLLANEHNQHYVLIRSLSALLSKRTKHNGFTFYCQRCLHGFAKEENLKKHFELCKKFKVQRTELPRDKYMEFKGYGKMIQLPLFVSADFECVLFKNEPGDGNTKKTARHEPCAFALKVSSPYPEYDKPVKVYRGKDAARVFILYLHELYQELKDIIEADEPMERVTPEMEAKLKQQKKCYLCDKYLPKKRSDRHLDHCHYTGKILGYAHPKCNMQRRVVKKLHVIIHNLRGYDSHLIIKELCRIEDNLSKVRLIPKNMEQYISIKTDQFAFVDSLQHLNASLDTLTENLKTEGEHKFAAVKQFIDHKHGGSQEKFNLLLRKGVYPYSYMDSYEKFEEELPPIECFFNDLKNEECSPEDYQHVQSMWREFNMQNLGDLCDIYVQSDVLLLTDIVNEYRRECWENFQLEALLYDTAPGLTWDAALRVTGVKLELLQDIDKILFCETAVRGGVSFIAKRKVTCNNKHLPNYDPSKPSNYIWYGDANNLYGGSMVEKLPISDFIWRSLTKQQIEEYDAAGDTGYFVECDLSIPNELHDKFNCFPIAAEPLEITEKIASPKSLEILKGRTQNEVPTGSKRKLPFPDDQKV